MAYDQGVPSLPYELLEEEDYDHARYIQSEYRDILALTECCTRNVGAYYKYFPHDHKNKEFMNRVMAEFFHLQERVEEFAQAAPEPWAALPFPRTEEQERDELKTLRYLSMKILARMPPAIEAYWLAPPTRDSPWCPPVSLPHVRQVTPHNKSRCLAKTVLNFRPEIQARMTQLRETEREKLQLRRANEDLRREVNRLRARNTNLESQLVSLMEQLTIN